MAVGTSASLTTELEKHGCIVVAGKPANGKSTALKNIFRVELTSGTSPRSVTKTIHVEVIERNGMELTVIDTPGLGDKDIPLSRVTKEMKQAIGKEYVLLYCLSVNISDRITEMDKTIIQKLHSVLGKEMWDKCVIFLTFSDVARIMKFPSPEDVENYKAYIRDYVNEFHAVMRSCGADVTVKCVFDYERRDFSESMSRKEIIAFPVGDCNSPVPMPNIMPGVFEEGDDWTVPVYGEAMAKLDIKRRQPFIIYKYGKEILNNEIIRSVSAGAFTGAGVGFLAGKFAGMYAIPISTTFGVLFGLASGTIKAYNMNTSEFSSKDKEE